MKHTHSIFLIAICFWASSLAAQTRTVEEQDSKASLITVDKRVIVGQAPTISTSAAKNLTFARQASIGKAALEKKDFKLARENFSEGLNAARLAGDKQAETRFLYYGGLVSQEAGEASDDQANLRNAVVLYQQVLERKPDSGATLINLAQVHSQLAETNKAERFYRQAIQLNNAQRPVYQTAYAGFLESQGRNKDARRLYTDLLKQDPFNQVARKALTEYYAGADADWGQLQSYLWNLVKSGEVDQSIDVALEALANRTSSQVSDEGLLTIIAASLSRKVGLAEGFLKSSTAKSLRPFSRRPTIGNGVRELFDIYRSLASFDNAGENADRRNYDMVELSWWTRGDPDQKTSPRNVMRQLLRTLGDRYSQRSKYMVAEACYEKAISFTPSDPDPAAIRDLVNLYAQLGEMDKIKEIADKYEFPLFQGKGQAYRNSELEKIYQYHRTLGQIYGYLAKKSGDWGSSNKSNSAIFQLEHAVEVGTMLDRQKGDDPDQHTNHIDPGLVDRLATAYAVTDSRQRSDELRLEMARHYQSLGDERAKTYVLKPVQVDKLAPVQIRQYQLLITPQIKPKPALNLEDSTLNQRRNRLDSNRQ
ncbi:MAG: leukotriene A4 hydrolase C-terminal domain-containing protein [Xanthomonadales bacterium]|nr:leukotriene A4 hydrolase C-terminal domain-containing protein [Xanthomonadales bacterium]